MMIVIINHFAVVFVLLMNLSHHHHHRCTVNRLISLYGQFVGEINKRSFLREPWTNAVSCGEDEERAIERKKDSLIEQIGLDLFSLSLSLSAHTRTENERREIKRTRKKKLRAPQKYIMSMAPSCLITFNLTHISRSLIKQQSRERVLIHTASIRAYTAPPTHTTQCNAAVKCAAAMICRTN